MSVSALEPVDQRLLPSGTLPNIIVIGKAGSGKSTVAKYLVQTHGYRQFGVVDPLRDLVAQLFPFESKPREVYQKLGDTLREIDPDCFIRGLRHRLASERDKNHWNGPFVIDDVRFLAEVHALAPVACAVLLEAPEEIRIQRMKVRDGSVDISRLHHHSEQEIDAIRDSGLDLHIYQNVGSIEDLYRFIERLITDNV